MERNYFEKLHRKQNYVEKRRPNDFPFQYIENISKRNIKTTTIFVFQKHIKIGTLRLHRFSIS